MMCTYIKGVFLIMLRKPIVDYIAVFLMMCSAARGRGAELARHRRFRHGLRVQPERPPGRSLGAGFGLHLLQ